MSDFLDDETYLGNRNARIMMILPDKETKEAAERIILLVIYVV